LVRSSEVWDLVNHAKEFGIKIQNPSLLWDKVIDRKEKIIKAFEEDKEKGLKERGIDLIRGEATFISSKTIKVNDREISADKFVLALGSKTATPPIEGIEHTINSTDALNIRELPKKMAIIGGGVIAMEFSHIFASAGADLTVIEMGDRLLANEDHDSSQTIEVISKELGIEVLLNSKVQKVLKSNDGKTIKIETPEGIKTIEVDQVLLATGRVPNVGELALERIGVKVEKTGIQVNEFLQTTVEHIYAGGDGIGGYMLTPVASYEGRVAAKNAIKNNIEKVDYSLVTRTTFTHPPIASIGLTEQEAVEKGMEIDSNRLDFVDVGPAVVLGETRGFVKLISDKKSKHLVGAHIVGPRAEELIHEIAIAMKGQLTITDLSEIISIHPSISEAVIGTAISADKGYQESCCG
jgi:dihydrolipoamide dehydrogenase